MPTDKYGFYTGKPRGLGMKGKHHMPRKKSYSSELAKIFDTSVMLSQQIKNFQETVAGLMTDSERLKEIEPLLNDINRVAAVMNPVKLSEPSAPPLGDESPAPPPGDESPAQPSGDESPAPPPSGETVKPTKRRTRKSKTNLPG